MNDGHHRIDAGETAPDDAGRLVSRVRYNTKVRLLSVARVERPIRWMVRLILAGDDLKGFESRGFDDHVKIFLPATGSGVPSLPTIGPSGPGFAEGVERPVARDYTPRRYDPDAGELTIEFAMHDAGPATAWAARAEPGYPIGIAGPRGSQLIRPDLDHHVLIGDETSLPAIARRLEEVPDTARVSVFAEVETFGDELPLDARDNVSVTWAYRNGGTGALLDTVRAADLPLGDAFVWVACESADAKRLRQYFVDEAGISSSRVKAASYWRRGSAAFHEVIGE